MAQDRITKDDLAAMCDDIAASFPHSHQTAAVDAMRGFIMGRLGHTEWMDRAQLQLAHQNIEKWFAEQPPDEQEHFQRVYDYVSEKLRAALENPSWQERLL